MIYQNTMIKRFIPIMQIFQNDIFSNVAFFGSDLFEVTLDLDLHVGPARGEEPAETETIAFALFEGRAFVEKGVVKDVSASDWDLERRHEFP